MPLGSSPRPAMAHLLRRPSLAASSEQRKLLEQHDSWPLAFGDKPHRPPLFPPHLVDALRQAYVARRDAAHAAEAPRPDVDAAEGEEQTGTRDACNSPAASKEISRASPPPRTPPRARVDVSAVREAPASRGVANNTGALPPGASAAEEYELDGTQDASNSPTTPDRISWSATPPRTRVDASDIGQTPQQTSPPRCCVNYEPSSSGERAMSVELPQALPRASPANIAVPLPTDGSHPPNTPIPCAQPAVIPGTASKDTKPVKPRQGGRRLRTKLFVFTSSPLKAAATTMAPKRMPSMAPCIDDVSSELSGSVIPATCQSPLTSKPIVAPVVTAAPGCPDSEKPAYSASSASQNIHATVLTGRQNPDHRKSSRLKAGSAGKTVGGTFAQHLEPLEAYVAAYPDYVTSHGGNLWNFVKACLYVDYLKGKRMLRDCLYDDFIRAFSGQYLHYVASAGPGQEPLVAIQWYNNQDGMPLYTSNVVTRKTLADILDVYPVEVSMARGLIDAKVGESRPERLERCALPTGLSLPQPASRAEAEQAKRTRTRRALPSQRPSARHHLPSRRALSVARPSSVAQTAVSLGRDDSEQAERTQTRRVLPAHWSSARQPVKPQHAEPAARQSLEPQPPAASGRGGAEAAERPASPVHRPRVRSPWPPSPEPGTLDATVSSPAAPSPSTSARVKALPLSSYFDRLSVRARLASRKRQAASEEERQGEGPVKRKRLSSGPRPTMTSSSRPPSPS